MSNSTNEILQYVPFKSFVHPTFWHKLAEVKIDVDKLSDAPKTIYGYYTNSNALDCLIEVDYSAFNRDFAPPKNNFTAHGTLYNKNTMEEFRDCDKSHLLHLEGKKFLNDINSGEIIRNPQLLTRFFILSFADLAVHKYFYWFAFPAPKEPIVQIAKDTQAIKLAENEFLNKKLPQIYNSLTNPEAAYFILKREKDDLKCLQFKEIITEKLEQNFINENMDDIFFCFSDPSEFDKPSWLLRLYIFFLCTSCPHLRNKVIQFIGIRLKANSSFETSLIWKVQIPNTSTLSDGDQVGFLGWEPNQNGKMGPKLSSMADTMNPEKLAENSVNLNLKLMKWRLLPELNLDLIFNTKCLLLGAGTLGCAVARNLLGWGFKNITFVDNGKVSYSNPVRQNLYRHEDAAGSKMKAPTAAQRVKEINSNSNVSGHVLQIPMPGHTIGDSIRESVLKDLQILEELVKSCDVIFLLTDSRESRWLPTLYGAFYKKIVINAALGFDSYLVMRHGSHMESNSKQHLEVDGLHCISGNELGCYFCNDVSAPGNSMRDRTLDQQCTVTRPGVSNIAASYAVELLVGLLHHEKKDLAPAYFASVVKEGQEIPEGLLGILPHSIRGSLTTFSNILPATSKFSQCTACSEIVLNEFKSKGNDFLMRVFETAKYLEDLTGISKFETFEEQIIEFGDSDSFSD